MKRGLAAALTVLVMAGLLWHGSRRPLVSVVPAPTVSGEAPGAASVVRGLLASAGRGDVAAYLSAFSGALRSRLEREAGERGLESFGAELRRASASRTSHAVFAAEPDGDGATSALVTVEAVFPDRNERQTYRVSRSSGVWLVDSVETVHSHTPASRVGSPADYLAPEGVPVQAGAAGEGAGGEP